MTEDSVVARRRAWRARKRKMGIMPFPHQPTDEEKRLLMTAAELIAAFRALDPKIPSSYMAGFIAVALNPGEGPTNTARISIRSSRSPPASCRRLVSEAASASP